MPGPSRRAAIKRRRTIRYSAMRLHATLTDAPRRNTASRSAMTHHRVPMRVDSGMITETPPAHVFPADAQMIAMQRSAVLEIAVTHRGHITIPMHIMSAPHVEAGANRDPDVKGRENTHTHSERRNVDFTEAQREPADHRLSHHHANREIPEGDQCRSKQRTNHDRARDPAPRAVDNHPAAKVERSPAPRSVIDPGPAIRLQPTEMPETVGRPSGNQTRRKPDVPIRRDKAPRAETVEIRIAGQVTGNIPGGNYSLFPPVTIHAKRIELIRRPDRVWSFECRVGVGTRDTRHHTQVQRRGLVAQVDFGVARPHHGDRRVTGFGDIHAIIAIPQQRKRKLRRVDLEPFRRGQGVQAHIDGPGGDFDLGHRVIQVQERKIGPSSQTNRRIVGLQFDEPIGLGPDMIAQHDWMIDFGRSPILDAGGLKRNSSGEITKARDPAGRRVIL
jgi:hypothetical protein